MGCKPWKSSMSRAAVISLGREMAGLTLTECMELISMELLSCILVCPQCNYSSRMQL